MARDHHILVVLGFGLLAMAGQSLQMNLKNPILLPNDNNGDNETVQSVNRGTEPMKLKLKLSIIQDFTPALVFEVQDSNGGTQLFPIRIEASNVPKAEFTLKFLLNKGIENYVVAESKLEFLDGDDFNTLKRAEIDYSKGEIKTKLIGF